MFNKFVQQVSLHQSIYKISEKLYNFRVIITPNTVNFVIKTVNKWEKTWDLFDKSWVKGFQKCDLDVKGNFFRMFPITVPDHISNTFVRVSKMSKFTSVDQHMLGVKSVTLQQISMLIQQFDKIGHVFLVNPIPSDCLNCFGLVLIEILLVSYKSKFKGE